MIDFFDKYTKLFLLVIALCAVALPAKAEEKVWYCEMTGLAQTTIDGADTYKGQRFRMKVTRTSVTFASAGFLKNVVLPMTDFITVNYFFAGDELSRIYYEDNVFNFATALDTSSVAITARCDDF